MKRISKKQETLKKILFLIQKNPHLIQKTISQISQDGLKVTLKKVQAKLHREYVLNHHCNNIVLPLVSTNEKAITIITPKHTLFVAYLLQKELSINNFSVHIMTDLPSKFADHLHIVICPQIYDRMPSLYISYQMEQSVNPRWFNEKYFAILKNSLAIFDYSLKNIEYLQQNTFSYKQLFFLPLSPFEGYKEFLLEKNYWDGTKTDNCEVLFYGDPNNERRKKYLQALQQKFSVKVVSEVFGNDLYRELLSAKVIVNIHFYENALLETTRIYECLSLGLTIVSEESSDMNAHETLKDRVHFARIGDIGHMVNMVQMLLAEKKSATDKVFPSLPNTFNFYLNRALISIDLVSFNALNPKENIPLMETKVPNMFCLGLPENIERRKSFEKDNLYDFTLFDGLRHSQGWIGCGLSYKYLISLAKASHLDYVIICEDDVEFPHDFKEKIERILSYLKKTEKKWDMFSGLIVDVHEDTIILDIEQFDEMEFIYIDKMTSTVFNIYHRSFYEKLINWDDKNHDVNTNTIDRYIESQGDLVVVTTLPFLVGHKEEQTSTIWHFQNKQYNHMFEKSIVLLQNKIDTFLEKK